MYIISKRQVESHEKESREQKTPYLYIQSNNFIKEDWVRYYAYPGEDVGNIPSFQKDSLSQDIKHFMNECSDKPESVYFTTLDKKTILMINHLKKEEKHLVVEHRNMCLRLVNYGALLTKLKINYIDIYYIGGRCKRLEGTDDCFTEIIANGGELVIYLDEATNNFIDSTCSINNEVYNLLSDYEQFSAAVNITTTYNKFVIGISVWNLYDEKSDFELIIERVGNFIRRRTINIEKKF